MGSPSALPDAKSWSSLAAPASGAEIMIHFST